MTKFGQVRKSTPINLHVYLEVFIMLTFIGIKINKSRKLDLTKAFVKATGRHPPRLSGPGQGIL